MVKVTVVPFVSHSKKPLTFFGGGGLFGNFNQYFLLHNRCCDAVDKDWKQTKRYLGPLRFLQKASLWTFCLLSFTRPPLAGAPWRPLKLLSCICPHASPPVINLMSPFRAHHSPKQQAQLTEGDILKFKHTLDMLCNKHYGHRPRPCRCVFACIQSCFVWASRCIDWTEPSNIITVTERFVTTLTDPEDKCQLEKLSHRGHPPTTGNNLVVDI